MNTLNSKLALLKRRTKKNKKTRKTRKTMKKNEGVEQTTSNCADLTIVNDEKRVELICNKRRKLTDEMISKLAKEGDIDNVLT